MYAHIRSKNIRINVFNMLHPFPRDESNNASTHPYLLGIYHDCVNLNFSYRFI